MIVDKSLTLSLPSCTESALPFWPQRVSRGQKPHLSFQWPVKGQAGIGRVECKQLPTLELGWMPTLPAPRPLSEGTRPELLHSKFKTSRRYPRCCLRTKTKRGRSERLDECRERPQKLPESGHSLDWSLEPHFTPVISHSSCAH